LKLSESAPIARIQEGQKAWKPDCGIETDEIHQVQRIVCSSEGLEARLRD